jgi:hypothetical protein
MIGDFSVHTLSKGLGFESGEKPNKKPRGDATHAGSISQQSVELLRTDGGVGNDVFRADDNTRRRGDISIRGSFPSHRRGFAASFWLALYHRVRPALAFLIPLLDRGRPAINIVQQFPILLCAAADLGAHENHQLDFAAAFIFFLERPPQSVVFPNPRKLLPPGTPPSGSTPNRLYA